MRRTHLKLVSSQPLPEVLLVRRLDEVRDALLSLPCTWYLPGAWFALYGALDRLEGQRLRMQHGR